MLRRQKRQDPVLSTPPRNLERERQAMSVPKAGTTAEMRQIEPVLPAILSGDVPWDGDSKGAVRKFLSGALRQIQHDLPKDWTK